MTKTSIPRILIATAAAALALTILSTHGVSGSDKRMQPRALSDGMLRTAANRIDLMVQAGLRRHGIEPNPLTDDATFVRRAYLDIVGRIPGIDEVRAFLGDQDERKRSRLIDRLLVSPGHESHMFNWWADLLRAKSRIMNNVSGEPYIHRIKEAVRDNEPFDRFVHELLVAEGPANERGNGATGYYLRDLGMPLDNMGNTARVFLGTRIECAQCHDHPFDRWTQREFYEMAAYAGGMQYRSGSLETIRDTRKHLEELQRRGQATSQTTRTAVRMLQPTIVGITGNGTGMVRLPKDYQYDDARPGDVITASPMFGDAAPIEFEDARTRRKNRRQQPRQQRALRPIERNSREVFADWMTSPRNPRFTMTIANRMWKRVMGYGLIEPVDNITDSTVASNPRLLDHLTELMIELDYDLREFERVLRNTETYQRESSAQAPVGPYHFPGPILRRMTAEQLWDSMISLVVPDLDATLAAPDALAEATYESYEELTSISIDELAQRAQMRTLRTTDPAKFRAMMQGEISRRQRQRVADSQERRERTQQLARQMRQARRDKDDAALEEARAALNEIRAEAMKQRKQRNLVGLVRASDLPSPAPAGHFLREFGQSDREQIENATDAATAPQVLSLMNGFIEDRVLDNPDAALVQTVTAAETRDAKIHEIYLAMLSREPSRQERDMWIADIDKAGPLAYRDMVWVLANSHEFRFVR